MVLFQKRKILILPDLLTVSKIPLIGRNIIYAYFMMQIIKRIPITGYANGNYFCICCIMQYGIRIMHGAVDCKSVDILKIRFIFLSFVCNNSIIVQFDQLIFISLIFNENRVKITIFIFQ